jgi:flavin-dependent dehydrogenase
VTLPGRFNTLGDYDVVVIGAGPAGCAAAIFCARHGLRVALLEQCAFPRERPGETLPPGIEPLLQQLDVADVVVQGDFIRHTGHWVQWGAERRFSAFGGEPATPWRGFQIPRATFDSLLLEKAVERGVHVVQPCRVNEVIRHNDRVIGARTTAGEFFSRQLIDASGSHSWLMRQLALDHSLFSPLLIAKYGYATGERAACDEAPGIVADAQGWYWTARVAPKLYNWTRLYFDKAQARQAGPPAMFDHLTAVGGIRGADVTWRSCHRTAGNGYFIVGDAAFVLDPGTSHGVLKAIMSGMMAAHAIIRENAFPRHRSAINTQYRQWMQRWFVRDMNAMGELYRSHPSPPHWLSMTDRRNQATTEAAGHR